MLVPAPENTVTRLPASTPTSAFALRGLLESDLFDRIRSDEDLMALVRRVAKRQAAPYAFLLHALVGTEATLSEDEARRTWLEAVAHRRVLAAVLQRPVHLRVALLDLLTLRKTPIRTPKLVAPRLLERTVRALTTDQLTDLGNREQFLAELHSEVGAPAPTAVALVDIDRFKAINDTHGHHVGDAVLRAFGRAAQRHSRSSDVFARIGGDEFGALFRGSSADHARLVLARVAHTFADEAPVPVGFSVGVVEARGGETAEAVLERADRAMYSQKTRKTRRASPTGAAVERAVAVYASDKPTRFLRMHVLFAAWGALLVPLGDADTARVLLRLLAPALLLIDVDFPPRGGRAFVARCATSAPSVLLSPGRRTPATLLSERHADATLFPSDAAQAERTLLGPHVGPRRSALAPLADTRQARGLMDAVARLAAGRSIAARTLATLRRPEFELVRSLLGG